MNVQVCDATEAEEQHDAGYKKMKLNNDNQIREVVGNAFHLLVQFF
jgi:hypothetical protein